MADRAREESFKFKFVSVVFLVALFFDSRGHLHVTVYGVQHTATVSERIRCMFACQQSVSE